MNFHKWSKTLVSGEENDSNSSTLSMVSERSTSTSQAIPFQYLLKLRLSTFQPPFQGDYGTNDQCTFFYDGSPISFDISDDCHTFMVSSLVHNISGRENEERLRATYLELEQELVDMRLEWNDEDEITLYQNLPIFLVEDDCYEEFQAILGRFLNERTSVIETLRRAGCPKRVLEKGSGSQKLRSLRNLFGGR